MTITVSLKERLETGKSFGFFVEDWNSLLFIYFYFINVAGSNWLDLPFDHLLLFGFRFSRLGQIFLRASQAFIKLVNSIPVENIMWIPELSFTLNMVLLKTINYPSVTLITANPFVLIFLIVEVGVDLLTKLTKIIVEIVLIATFTQKSISGCLYL